MHRRHELRSGIEQGAMHHFRVKRGVLRHNPLPEHAQPGINQHGTVVAVPGGTDRTPSCAIQVGNVGVEEGCCHPREVELLQVELRVYWCWMNCQILLLYCDI